MVRAPCCEKMGLKRGPWSPEEDQLLISYIHQYGHQNWRALPKQAGLLRCGKSCRLRWINYLKPDIKRGNLSQEEEETIIKLHEMLGNRWSAIAARLPGRTDNEIKNVWNTHLKKRLKDNQSSCNTKQCVRILNTKTEAKVLEKSGLGNSGQLVTSPRSSEVSSVTNLSIGRAIVKKEEMDYSSEYSPQIDESFWTEELSTEVSTKAKIEVNATENLELDLKNDESMDYWYDIFIGAGDMPDLPEF